MDNELVQQWCVVRLDLRKEGLSVPIGEKFYYASNRPLRYRWINETKDYEGDFQVYYKKKWREAYSIDFDFIE